MLLFSLLPVVVKVLTSGGCLITPDSEGNVVIPDRWTVIPQFAFYGCSELVTVQILSSVTSIQRWSFAHCDNLQSIVIPETVLSVGGAAFFNCANLTDVSIKNANVAIAPDAFSGCPCPVTIFGQTPYVAGVELVNCLAVNATYTWPPTVAPPPSSPITSAGETLAVTHGTDYCEVELDNFVYCVSDSLYADGNNGENSGDYGADERCAIHVFATGTLTVHTFATFDRDDALTVNGIPYNGSVGPNNVEVHGGSTIFWATNQDLKYSTGFRFCLNNLTLSPTVSPFSSSPTGSPTSSVPTSVPTIAPSVSEPTSSPTTSIPTKSPTAEFALERCMIQPDATGTVQIPATWDTVPMYAFIRCQNLTTLIISEGVKHIQKKAFLKCTSLESVIIAASVESVGSESFKDCTNLRSYNIKSTATTMFSNSWQNAPCSTYAAGVEAINCTQTSGNSFSPTTAPPPTAPAPTAPESHTLVVAYGAEYCGVTRVNSTEHGDVYCAYTYNYTERESCAIRALADGQLVTTIFDVYSVSSAIPIPDLNDALLINNVNYNNNDPPPPLNTTIDSTFFWYTSTVQTQAPLRSNLAGWRVCLKPLSVPPPVSSKDSSSSISVGAIVGIIVGVIALIAGLVYAKQTFARKVLTPAEFIMLNPML